MSDLHGVDWTRVVMGDKAFKVAMNLIVQTYPDGKAAGVFQTAHGLPLHFGSKRSHILVLGDMIYRPRMVIASDAMRGMGISHLFTHGFSPDEWATGDVLLNRGK